MMASDYAFWAAIAVMSGCSLYFGPRIPRDRIAMQWGVDGRPTWHAPKFVGLWGSVILALAVRLFIWGAMTFAPEKVQNANVGLLLFSVIVAGAHLFVLVSATRTDADNSA
jgi:hypothetical protein